MQTSRPDPFSPRLNLPLWLVAVGVMGLLGINLRAQQPLQSKPPSHPTASRMQGVWVNNTITPFERPAQLAGREFLTGAEIETPKERAARLFSGSGDVATGDELFLTLLQNPVEYRGPSDLPAITTSSGWTTAWWSRIARRK